MFPDPTANLPAGVTVSCNSDVSLEDFCAMTVLTTPPLREFTNGEFFKKWEGVVTTPKEAFAMIDKIIEFSSPERTLVWRGVVDATHSLHSSLYRRLSAELGRWPKEKDMVAFERNLLRESRTSWRFDDLNALETFAQIQHFGGPTRLLDVTFNPLIALWFAVEKQYELNGDLREDIDGRLFAFDASSRQMSLNRNWDTREIPWGNSLDRRWGSPDLPWSKQTPIRKSWTQELPYIWRPPNLNERIAAQNSASLVGGVPTVDNGGNRRWRKGPGNAGAAGYWNKSQIQESSSVVLQMNSLLRKPSKSATPTFTLRISANAKEKIRDILENNYGYNSSTLYPDLLGLATHGANRI